MITRVVALRIRGAPLVVFAEFIVAAVGTAMPANADLPVVLEALRVVVAMEWVSVPSASANRTASVFEARVNPTGISLVSLL